MSGTLYRQITCLTRTHLTKDEVVIPSDTRFDIPPGETITLADIPGPGRIVRFWMTLPVIGRGSVLRSAVLRMYWDDEKTPSVQCPLGDFFGAGFARPVPFVSDRLSIAGGGYCCQFEMPFNRRALITVENQSPKRLRLLVFHIGYHELKDPITPLRTFHALWHRQDPTEKGQSYVALRAEGRGQLAGLRMDMQNRTWWLRPPLRAMFFPRGLGLGMLEGPEHILVDDEPAIEGTGTEDFFGGGWYFKGKSFQTPTHGAPVCSFLTGRVSAYRFFIHDPVPFERSLEVGFDHGIGNQLLTDHCSVAYWYQQEPHAPPPPLAPEPARRPRSTLPNVLQPLVGAGLVAMLAALLLYGGYLLWT